MVEGRAENKTGLDRNGKTEKMKLEIKMKTAWVKLLLAGLVFLAGRLPLGAQPVITTNLPANQYVSVGSTVTFNVTATGSGPLAYQWRLNSTNLPGGIITTVAGNGIASSTGDGGQATSANLYYPGGVASDAAGNLFIADTDNNRIREVYPNGYISTEAGTGSSGYSGNGGAAILATMHYPSDVKPDNAGKLFIADTLNNCIRKVDTNSIITTMAGTNSAGYSGDGGAATLAKLSSPGGVGLDVFGNLFIADTGNNCIRKVDINGIITTVAGTNSSGFSGDLGPAVSAKLNQPHGVMPDNLGNLFIADMGNNRIRKVDVNGIITTVAGTNSSGYSGDGGAAVLAKLNAPAQVLVDAYGYLFIADKQNQRIRMVDANGKISTIAGTGSIIFSGDGGAATNANIYLPCGTALDPNGNLLICDQYDHRIRKVGLNRSPQLMFSNVATNANGYYYDVIVTNASGSVTSSVVTLSVGIGPAVTGQPQKLLITNSCPASFSVAVSGAQPLSIQWRCNGTNLADGNIFSGSVTTNLLLSAATMNNNGAYDVVITNSWGSVTSSVAMLSVGFVPGIALQPTNALTLVGGIAIFNVLASGTGPFYYQWQLNGTNLPNNIITTVAGNGVPTYNGDGIAATNASLHYPEGVGFDFAGNLYIADHINNRIRKVDTNGIITTVAGNGTNTYAGDGGAATNASLFLPANLAWDAAGNMYIVDQNNNRIRKVDTNGIITTLAGKSGGGYSGDGGAGSNANLNYPYGLAIDTTGNLYVGDQFNNRIRKINSNGFITTVAGNGNAGYTGDGGPATNALLYYPLGAPLDGAGNMFIADSIGNVVRKVDINGMITRVAGSSRIATFAGDGGWATNATFNEPFSSAFDAFGNLYISDNGNNRIRKVDTNGIITTVVGNGSATYAGDGNTATNASINGPQGMAFDAAGNLYIGDWGNHRIRKVNFPGNPTLAITNVNITNAGNYSVIISSLYGSMTSSVVTLTVNVPPTIQRFNPTNGQFVFTWSAVSNLTYQLQVATNLTAPNWQDLGSPVTATNNTVSASDAVGADGQRFYRVRSVP